jgi:alpha-glucan,water dikinase
MTMKRSETVSTRSGLLLRVLTKFEPNHLEVSFQGSTGKPCVLHWGVRGHGQSRWTAPPQSCWPEGTQEAGASAVQTRLSGQNGQSSLVIRLTPPNAYASLDFVLYFPDERQWDNNGGRDYHIDLAKREESGQGMTAFAQREAWNTLRLELPEQDAPLGIPFVLWQEEPTGRWINYRGANFYVPVRAGQPTAGVPGLGPIEDLADEIVRAETTHNSWTLMHRFNLCHDLLERVHNQLDGQALLYVWLRFSAIRQLTWQRNYNTKPRELAHAQDRLSHKLAAFYRQEPASRPLVRLALATVGRGGEGQRIRDEILNIMHRHHVKEMTGNFLEEWHQKLHNNTTPDDVVICEAYLEFLRSHGHRDRFYQTLEAGGVSRQRLERFERPIRSHPDFVPHLRDGLIQDFQHFLIILKASHSGTDFETAIQAARDRMEGGMQGLLHYLSEHRNDPPEGLVNLVNKITDARRRVSNLLHQSDGLRELLYLDLALEQVLRGAVERNIHLGHGGETLADLIARVLENVTLSYEDPELAACSRHWDRLQTAPRFGPEWSLHAKSVVDRVARALGAWIDRFYQLLQPKAEFLGRGFHAEPWTITLFSEEVVRGSSLGFVLSLLLHHLDPILRQAARIGDWQVVSRGRGSGRVEIVDTLRSIQGRRFDQPAIVVANQVQGDEEIPEGVTAVIAPDVVDIVSHVAVRARNANLLFAACHNGEVLQHLKSLRGCILSLEVNPAGDVIVVETSGESPPTPARIHTRQRSPTARSFRSYAVSLPNFNETIVGGKSCHQARLHGHLPDWIQLSPSVALPFGVFEHVLGLTLNQGIARRYTALTEQAERSGTEILATLRNLVCSLEAPEELKVALRETMTGAGLDWPADWEKTWNRIKRVWASKWNDRAFLNRKRMGLRQRLVSADYAFVIHTVNPSTGNRHELFAEVVLGLGETLVGNHPGRALSFVWNKSTGRPILLSYPSKSVGLYGTGLIFRSDSNGEDLPGYAGAGLYDSVLLDSPRHVTIDYTLEPLIWDEAFRQNLLTAIARLGLEVEQNCGAPQDIEGVVAQGSYYLVQTRPQVGLD